MSDEVNKLHPHERRILLALKKLREEKIEVIAKEAGLPVAAVHKAGLWAKVKGLIEHRVEITPELSPTQEGEKYIKEGLPEKRLIAAVKSGKANLADIRKIVPELNIALAWSKKNNWIEINEGKVSLTAAGQKALSEETAVEKALKTRQASGKLLEDLVSRGIISVKERKEKTFILTQKGKEIVPKLKDEIEEGIGTLTPEIIKSENWKKQKFRPYELSAPVPTVWPAKIHPYTSFINQTRLKLASLGFAEMKSGFVESEFWNFDALFMPQDHPAKSIHDVFELKTPQKGEVLDKLALQRVGQTHKNGWITGSRGWGNWNSESSKKLVLRSQTTAVSARILASQKPKTGKFFTIDRTFRPDVLDQRHSFEFHQCEGIVIGEHLGLRHLLGYLKLFGTEIAGAKEIRFRPSYFPFTEPSVEMDCLVGEKWVELGGAGIFRPEVTRPLGVDVPVLAWGLGFARLAMIKLGISDIRELFSQDINWLRERRI